MGEDENTKVILMYIEELSNGQEFIQTAREVAKIKPVVAIKSGVTQSGARAVSSTQDPGWFRASLPSCLPASGRHPGETRWRIFLTWPGFWLPTPLWENESPLSQMPAAQVFWQQMPWKDRVVPRSFEIKTIQTLEKNLS